MEESPLEKAQARIVKLEFENDRLKRENEFIMKVYQSAARTIEDARGAMVLIGTGLDKLKELSNFGVSICERKDKK